MESIAERLQRLEVVLLEVVRLQQELGPAGDRLDNLERERAQFQAEIEGLLLRADGKLRAANNSEARERQLKKSYERLVDTVDEPGDAEKARRHSDSSDDGAPSEEDRVLGMHMAVASTNKKTLAQRAKFGVKDVPRRW